MTAALYGACMVAMILLEHQDVLDERRVVAAAARHAMRRAARTRRVLRYRYRVPTLPPGRVWPPPRRDDGRR